MDVGEYRRFLPRIFHSYRERMNGFRLQLAQRLILGTKPNFKKRQEVLASSEAGMVAAGGVLEVIVEDAGLSVTKSDLYQG